MSASQSCRIEKAQELYDREYYVDGLVTGKSCYQNYRWMSEMTIKMAFQMYRYLGFDDNTKILDYGCSMGYVVKAMRILDVDAWGCDISEYAIKHADPDAVDYLLQITEDSCIPFDFDFDWIITKDVLEHVSEEDIDCFLKEAKQKTERMFHVIPLADEYGKFRVPDYHKDPSHIQIQHEDWWTVKFESHGWEVERLEYVVKGIKENWTSVYPDGNGFFTLKKR